MGNLPGVRDFNPRTPCGVRPGYSYTRGRQRNFNPRTPCGVRLGTSRTSSTLDRYFNPRTPCGVRHEAQQLTAVVPAISIHAPRVGCDAPPNPAGTGR